MYQRVGKAAYKADLANTLLLADHLNNPENAFKSVHIAGTNGKGSTSHMLASVLQHARYKVGLYTSPHLKDFRERIRINGKMISEDAVVDFVSAHIGFFEENKLSFFEMTVGLAFDHFRKEQVEIAIIEVGLGGRLDSTNIIRPELSIITNIGIDHTAFLGNTLADIAAEKAGIIKQGIPVLVGEKHPETQYVFEQFAEQEVAPIYFAEDMIHDLVESDLRGLYQKNNVRTCLGAIDILRNQGWDIPDHALSKGMMNVVKTTGLQGRWQVLDDEPKTICDTAHNKEGLQLVLNQLSDEKYKQLHIILGVVNDKDLERILPLFPTDATYYFCKPDVPRGMDAELLRENAVKYNLLGAAYSSVQVAYQDARMVANKNDLIFIGGSTFTVAEVL